MKLTDSGFHGPRSPLPVDKRQVGFQIKNANEYRISNPGIQSANPLNGPDESPATDEPRFLLPEGEGL